jgi:hypothetical protein
VNPILNPTFSQVSPICAGSTLNALPTTSNNGINGAWTPALNNLVTTTYTFTPNMGECGTTTTMTIIVNPLPLAIITTTPANGVVCEGGNAILNAHVGANYDLQFDGVDDMILFANNPSLQNLSKFTVEAYINPVTFTDQQTIFANRSSYYDQIKFSANFTQGLLLSMGTAGSTLIATTNNPIPLNTWTHAAATFDGTQSIATDKIKLFINGVAQSLSFYATDPLTATHSMNTIPTIGCESPYASGTFNSFNGRISDVRLWNTARTEGEIFANMNACLAGNESGLIANYTCNEGMGISISSNTASPQTGNFDTPMTSTAWQASKVGCSPPISATWSNGVINNIAFVPPAAGTYTVNVIDARGCSQTGTVSLSLQYGVLLSAKVILQGPYDSISGLMHDSLRIKNLIPSSEPFTNAPYNKLVLGDVAGETVDSAVLAVTGANAIVDWVYLELRSSLNYGIVVATKRALLQRDGDIVSNLDGVSPVKFSTSNNGNYYVSVKHRNHLGVMSFNTIGLNACTTTILDLTNSSKVYTLLAQPATSSYEPRKQIGSKYVMWSGDSKRDKNVKYNGLNNDKDYVSTALGGPGFLNATLNDVYRSEDNNMDGKIRFNNTDNDRVIIINNIGIGFPNNLINQHTPN